MKTCAVFRARPFKCDCSNFEHHLLNRATPGGRSPLHQAGRLADAKRIYRQVLAVRPSPAKRGARLVIESQTELVGLVQATAGDVQVVPRGQALPHFDTHCSLLSLPRVSATDLTNVPRSVSYLHAGIEAVEAWRIRLACLGNAQRVGLVCAGQPAHKNDYKRSMRLADFPPLAEISGVSCFSLQQGAAAAHAKAPGLKFELFDLTAELNVFSDTAGMIANLDLVIGVDTAVVHLAGAMGKPVWTLLPFAPDWRWLRGRDDSPCYPDHAPVPPALPRRLGQRRTAGRRGVARFDLEQVKKRTAA